MHGSKDSEITRESSKWGAESAQKKFEEQIREKRVSLVDNLPSSKKLGGTIMFPSAAYDFGGLLSDPNEDSHAPKAEVKPSYGSARGWTQPWGQLGQLTGLLSDDLSTDMKESIHCGPDTRSAKFTCDALKGFGREIKESIVAFQE
jgi:hypothetical protein